MSGLSEAARKLSPCLAIQGQLHKHRLTLTCSYISFKPTINENGITQTLVSVKPTISYNWVSISS